MPATAPPRAQCPSYLMGAREGSSQVIPAGRTVPTVTHTA